MHFIEVAVTLITDQINVLKSSLDLWEKGTDMYFKVLNCSNITGYIHSMKTMNDRIKQTLFLNSWRFYHNSLQRTIKVLNVAINFIKVK